MKVLFLPEVRVYFEELSVILYQKEYFGFFESALRYTDELFSEIENSLPLHSRILLPVSNTVQFYLRLYLLYWNLLLIHILPILRRQEVYPVHYTLLSVPVAYFRL
jgi:hypothetical protein